MVGINLSGAEFGKPGGAYGWSYIYPSASDLKLYSSQGVDVVRLPFQWERMQPTLNGPLDAAELGRLKSFLSTAASQGVEVIVDLHNYGRYNKIPIGEGAVTPQAFADFWKKLATALKDQPGVAGYDLMNEPHDMGGADRWPKAAQMATDAIRTVDMKHDIYVEGDGWSGASSWQKINANLDIKDPANKIIYEAHQYFDNNNSGTYDASYDGEGAYANVGVDRLKPFTDWLKATGNKGFIGEFAVPDNDPRWVTVLDNFMDAMKAAGVGGTYWGAGPWWGNYPMALYGGDGKPNPQMAALLEHVDDLGGSTAPTPTPTPTPSPAPTPAPTPTVPAIDKTITGTSGNDTLNGGDANDTIIGLGGNDTINGGGGNDFIDADGGMDMITGGAGKDVFDFNATSDSRGSAADHIRDFQRGTDKIDLSTMDANSKVLGNQAFKFVGSAEFGGTAGEVRFTKVDVSGTAGDHVLVKGDTNGDRLADFTIIIDGGLSALSATDFIL